MLRIYPASDPEHYQQARLLFQHYADSLDFDLGFQNFNLELALLPGDYAPPEGCILLAEDAGKYVGCVALRPLDKQTCEMKRLFLLPPYRGRKIGQMLVNAIITTARQLGYQRMRLDTITSMQAAIDLYRSFGFQPIEAYCYNPHKDASYMELALGK